MKYEKKQNEIKREDTIYAFIRPDDDRSESCLRLNLEYAAKFDNCQIVFGDASSGAFSPPPCFACVVDRSIVGKANWEQHLRSVETVPAAEGPVYVIIDKEEYVTPAMGKYVIIHTDECKGGATAKINDTVRRLKFMADCEAGRDAEHMPPGLDSVFAATGDKNLRASISRWAENNHCAVLWNEDKDFEPALGTYPMCCVFDRMSIDDATWKEYQEILSPNINIVDEVTGTVIYSCVEAEDDYYCVTIEDCRTNPEPSFKKGVQITMDRKEAHAKIMGYLDEARRYRDETVWPRMRNGYMADCVEVLRISPK